MTAAAARPTLPGMVDGVVALDPFTLACRPCGVEYIAPPGQGIAVSVLVAGWWFHVCDGPHGVRHCPTCLAAAVAACPNGRCKR